MKKFDMGKYILLAGNDATEEKANKIIEKLGFSSKEQPKKNFFKK
jgi:hypothetical protein